MIREADLLINVFAFLLVILMPFLLIFSVQCISTYDHMIPHVELHSRSHTISSFTYRASKLIGFALLLLLHWH